MRTASKRTVLRAVLVAATLGLVTGTTGCKTATYKARKASPLHDTPVEKVEKKAQKADKKIHKTIDR